MEAFAASLIAVSGYSPKTASNYRLYVGGFLRWWSEQGDLTGVGTADLQAYVAAEAHRGIAPATRQSIVNGLRAFFRYLHDHGHVETDPAERLRGPRVPPPATDIYRPGETDAILAHLAALDDVRGRQRHAMLATLRYTGLRASELAHLPSAGLDLAARRAEVTGKGARHRVLVLPRPLAAVLAAHLAEVRPRLPDSAYVFANPGARDPDAPYSLRSVYDEVVRAGEGARVAGRHHPHKWRHTFATELLRADVDVHTVQRLLGHSNVSATVRYAHLADDDLRRRLDDVF